MMVVMVLVMPAAPAMADKGGDPHQGSWGYGSSFKKRCKENGGDYIKVNKAGHGQQHQKAQICVGP